MLEHPEEPTLETRQVLCASGYQSARVYCLHFVENGSQGTSGGSRLSEDEGHKGQECCVFGEHLERKESEVACWVDGLEEAWLVEKRFKRPRRKQRKGETEESQ